MSSDAFKYHNPNHLPTATGTIQPTKKTSKYAIMWDMAQDVSESFYQFSAAFYSSAELIVDRMLDEHHIDELDKYFFPVFFLYRHSIELLLKSIGCIFITDRTHRVTFIRDTFHNPADLLQYILRHTPKHRPKAEIQWLAEYFQNISNFDKASDSFRYPFRLKTEIDDWGTTKHSLCRVFTKQTHIDLIGEVNKMSAAYEILTMWRLDFLEENHIHLANEYCECSTQFLEEGGSYYEQSVVGYEYRHDDFYAYCSGYMECGNYLKQRLIEKVENDGISDIAHLFYPMCYLYRNEIELLLKTTIYTCSTLTPENICHVTTENKHKICKLFGIIEQQILLLYSLESNDPYIQNAKRYCKILHEFDTDSSRFRYPVDRNCFPYINSIRYYDFVELGEFLEALCNALDGIYSEIDYRRDYLAQMQAEYADYC